MDILFVDKNDTQNAKWISIVCWESEMWKIFEYDYTVLYMYILYKYIAAS